MIQVFRFVLALFLAVGACLPSATGAAQAAAGVGDDGSVSLRPAFVAGQSCVYRFEGLRNQKAETTFAGRTQAITTDIVNQGEMSWTVDRVKADGGAECTMTLLWMTLDITSSEGEEQKNDSRKSEGDIPLLHDLLQAMSGKPVTVEVNPDGSIESVRGLEAIRAAAENPELVPDERDFRETASDATTLPFAPAALALGDDWTSRFTWRHELGDATQRWTNTLTAVEVVDGVKLAVIDQEQTALSIDSSSLTENLPAGAPRPSLRVTEHSGSNRVLFDLTRSEAAARHSQTLVAAEVTLPLGEGRRAVTRFEERSTNQMLRIEEK